MSYAHLLRIAAFLFLTATVYGQNPILSISNHRNIRALQVSPLSEIAGELASPELSEARNNLDDCETHGAAWDSRVAPPCSKPFGSTYSEWSLAWWRWFLQRTAWPDAIQGCGVDQSGPVFYLIGLTGQIDCSIPSGKALFFPIVNAECSNLEDPPFYGKDKSDRRKCVKEIIDTVNNLAVEIDGRSVHSLKDYRFATGDFPFTVPDGNLAGIPTDKSHSGRSSADGYYLMLAPLPPGRHTLHFTGTFGIFSYTLDATYTITVRSARRD